MALNWKLLNYNRSNPSNLCTSKSMHCVRPGTHLINCKNRKNFNLENMQFTRKQYFIFSFIKRSYSSIPRNRPRDGTKTHHPSNRVLVHLKNDAILSNYTVEGSKRSGRKQRSGRLNLNGVNGRIIDAYNKTRNL